MRPWRRDGPYYSQDASEFKGRTLNVGNLRLEVS
jgi:hypothetical protein